jgi:hypothetical protein
MRDKLVREEYGTARRKKHAPEQIVNLLRQVEVAAASGTTTPAACSEGGITEQTYLRWRKDLGGFEPETSLCPYTHAILRCG